MPTEENAIVLDYLAKGKSSSYKSEPIAQVIGVNHFTLLEVVPKQPLKIMDTVYVGKETREEIDYIKKRIQFKELTSTAQNELEKVINKIVLDNTQRFLGFYNNSTSITIKLHQLELLPGLGKKHMQDILKEREKKPFESFEDIAKRVYLMPDPVQAIVKRVIEEIEGIDIKYYIFARQPVQDRGFFHHRRPFQRYS